MKFIKVLFLITLILSVETELTRYEKIELLKSLDKYLKKPEKNSYKKLNNLRSDIALTTIAAIVGAACAIYKVGVYLFGYKKTVEFNDIPMERGFEYFDSKAIVHYADSVPLSKMENVKKIYKIVLDIQKNDKENNAMIDHMFQFIEFEDMNGWGKQDILFKTKSDKSRVSYASILAGHEVINKKDIFHLFLVSTKAKFKLAPALKMKVTTSGFGVTTKKVKSEIIEIPNSVTPQDIQSVFYFFNFFSIKQMANYFGKSFEYPKIQLNDKSKKKKK